MANSFILYHILVIYHCLGPESISRFVFLLSITPTRKGPVTVVVPPQNFHSGANFSAPSFRNCLIFALHVDPSVVVGGGVAVE